MDLDIFINHCGSLHRHVYTVNKLAYHSVTEVVHIGTGHVVVYHNYLSLRTQIKYIVLAQSVGDPLPRLPPESEGLTGRRHQF